MADLALDTLIYNGHTTTSDALWAGLPVVAVLGEHFASRVSASLLGAAGLKELVASDVDGYVELALRFAANAEWRNSVRSRLAAARATAPLFDTSRSVRGMEQAYEKIWAQFLSGAAPADIYV
jgi:predicted O-linked N-acetylglucosamine transferase (SPINDLY family)